MAQLSPVIELVHLPNEVLHNIFKDVRPWDLAAVAVTCRTLRNSLQDRQLFKEVYMRILVSCFAIAVESWKMGTRGEDIGGREEWILIAGRMNHLADRRQLSMTGLERCINMSRCAISWKNKRLAIHGCRAQKGFALPKSYVLETETADSML